MREGFHAHHGWFFRREPDGNVAIEVAESAAPDAPLKVGASFDADTWASIVAAVSAHGENSGTFYAAQNLHMGEPIECGTRWPNTTTTMTAWWGVCAECQVAFNNHRLGCPALSGQPVTIQFS